jgi:hypothetical protein
MVRAGSNLRRVGVRFGNVHSLRNAKRGFGAIINRALASPQAIRNSDGRFVVIIRTDVVKAMLEKLSDRVPPD